jgi:hypothetical protein
MMTDLSSADAALLRWIATPAVDGVPGACRGKVLDALLSAELVTIGVVPSQQVTAASAWVRPTDAGLAWIAANPPA